MCRTVDGHHKSRPTKGPPVQSIHPFKGGESTDCMGMLTQAVSLPILNWIPLMGLPFLSQDYDYIYIEIYVETCVEPQPFPLPIRNSDPASIRQRRHSRSWDKHLTLKPKSYTP